MHLPVLAVIMPFLMLSSPLGIAQEQRLEPGFSNGVPYLSGGIGDEELAEIDRARPNYNTRLVLLGTTLWEQGLDGKTVAEPDRYALACDRAGAAAAAQRGAVRRQVDLVCRLLAAD